MLNSTLTYVDKDTSEIIAQSAKQFENADKDLAQYLVAHCGAICRCLASAKVRNLHVELTVTNNIPF